MLAPSGRLVDRIGACRKTTLSPASAAPYPRRIVDPLPNAEPPPFLARFRRVTTSGGFIAEIDGLRFVAIFLVFVFHVAVDAAIKAPDRFTPPAGDLAAAVAWGGFRGVELFFVISGLILGMPFAAHALKGRPRVRLGPYLLRRLTRLEPPYIVAMVLLFALHVVVRGRPAALLRPHLFASLGYVHNLVYGVESAINNVSWSLEIEIQFYLLAPVLAAVFAIRDKRVRRTVLVALCAASVGLSWAFIPPGTRPWLSILRFLHFFLLGFLLADVYLTDWNERPAQGRAWDAVSLLGLPALFWVSHGARLGTREPLLNAFALPALAFLLYCAAFRGRFSNRALVNPWISTIGGMCYSIYLLHNPVLGGVLATTLRLPSVGSYAGDLLVQIAATIPLVLVPAAVFFVAVEKPCMRRDWPQRLLARLRGTGAAVRAE